MPFISILRKTRLKKTEYFEFQILHLKELQKTKQKYSTSFECQTFLILLRQLEFRASVTLDGFWNGWKVLFEWLFSLQQGCKYFQPSNLLKEFSFNTLLFVHAYVCKSLKFENKLCIWKPVLLNSEKKMEWSVFLITRKSVVF